MSLAPIATVEDFISLLKTDFPDLKFRRSRRDFWSPGTRTINYNPERSLGQTKTGLLHELAHALLGHTTYQTDFELLKMEAEAWHKAAELGKKYGENISEEHIQNCLDTYRDWLHRRSTCPACGTHSLQKNARHYQCLNCQTKWSVTSQRFARPYRRLS